MTDTNELGSEITTNSPIDLIALQYACLENEIWEEAPASYRERWRLDAAQQIAELPDLTTMQSELSAKDKRIAELEECAWPDFAAPPKYENPPDGWEDPRLPDFQKIWETARKLGYAVALHGSMKRDCDLVAVPWVDNASPWGELVHDLCMALDARVVGGKEIKPNGRIAFSLQINGYYKLIDLSIIANPVKSETTPVTECDDPNSLLLELKDIEWDFSITGNDAAAATIFAAATKIQNHDTNSQVSHVLEIGYTNYRGEFGVRKLKPIRLWFGATDWHKKPQWLMEAWDCGKRAKRDFALKDFAVLGSDAQDPALMAQINILFKSPVPEIEGE